MTRPKGDLKLSDAQLLDAARLRGSSNPHTKRRQQALYGYNLPKHHGATDAIRDAASRVGDFGYRWGVGLSLYAIENLSEGFGGLKDFFFSNKSQTRGSAGQRWAATLVTLGVLTGGVAAGAQLDNNPKTVASTFVDDIRMMELDTGRDRFADRAARVEKFRDNFSGILSRDTLDQFECSIKNPNDGAKLRERFINQFNTIVSIAQQASEIEAGDRTGQLQVKARVSEFFDDEQNNGFFTDRFDRNNPESGLSEFLGAFDATRIATQNGRVPETIPPDSQDLSRGGLDCGW